MSSVGSSKGVLKIAKFGVYAAVPIALMYRFANNSTNIKNFMGNIDLSSGSSDTSKTRSLGGRKVCDCGLPAKVFTSRTKMNPGRKFFGCQLYKDGGSEHCKYFDWFDEKRG